MLTQALEETITYLAHKFQQQHGRWLDACEFGPVGCDFGGSGSVRELWGGSFEVRSLVERSSMTEGADVLCVRVNLRVIERSGGNTTFHVGTVLIWLPGCIAPFLPSRLASSLLPWYWLC